MTSDIDSTRYVNGAAVCGAPSDRAILEAARRDEKQWLESLLGRDLPGQLYRAGVP